MLFTYILSILKERSLLFVFLLFVSTILIAQSPSWEVNPSSYEHSMTLTSVVLDVNAAYSVDEITIGIFNGDECVGISITDTYFPPINANLAFVLIYGNLSSATYQVKVFMNNEVFDAGNIEFISNAVLGTLDVPYEIQPIFDTAGCMDEVAVNYNPLAISDDGSCYYPIYGCTDETAYNYNPLANTDDGSCLEIVIGCTDPSYLEYNELANSGFQQVLCLNLIVTGCTNPLYFEYNILANVADNSCVQTWQNAYQLQALIIDSLYEEVDNCTMEITIDFISGWNLIGFVNAAPQEATIAFESVAELIIVVKNNFGDVYYPEYNFNGIGDLVPGNGYQVKTLDSIIGFQF